jgi:hypothetical protein
VSVPRPDGASGRRDILALALPAAAIWAAFSIESASAQPRLFGFLAGFGLLVGVMLLARRVVRRDARAFPLALAAAFAFRTIAALGPPVWSDDLWRYVWDGRVQLHGVHPYRYAPTAPELAGLRDESWSAINHPELKTIYPPLAEATFLTLAALGAGPVGFKLAFGLADFGVVLALDHLLRRRGLPRDRVILYAWNPLPIVESAGSGHVEPVGVLLAVLAGAWLMDRRPVRSMLALAAGVHVKLFPLALAGPYLRRTGVRMLAVLLPALALPLALYGATGPPLGAGLVDYAERWERNAALYALVEAPLATLDPKPALEAALGMAQRAFGGWPVAWDFLYRHSGPRDLSRATVAVLAVGFVVWVARRKRGDLVRDSLLAFGGPLLLSPTIHPWYLLWVLPWAAACASPAWLVLCSTVVLAYAGGTGDVPCTVRALEFLPPLAVALWGRRRSIW